MNIIISGAFCIEYNDGGRLIQRQQLSPFNESLLSDEFYLSTQSYKCKKKAYDLHEKCILLNSFETNRSILIHVCIYRKKFYYGIFLDQDCYNKTQTMYSTTDKIEMSTGKSNTKTHSNSDTLAIWYKFPIQLNKTQTVLFCVKSLFILSNKKVLKVLQKMKLTSPESLS